jgi:Polypeptide deformylase
MDEKNPLVMVWQQAALGLILIAKIVQCWKPTVQRRAVLLLGTIFPGVESTTANIETMFHVEHPFHYTDDWIGTKLPILSLEESAKRVHWEMGKWPDPILRTPAALVDMDQYQGTALLHHACDELQRTAIVNGAVGLAAQQCGVNARLIYLAGQNAPAFISSDRASRCMGFCRVPGLEGKVVHADFPWRECASLST